MYDLTHLYPLVPEGSVEKRAKRHNKTFKRMAYFLWALGLILNILIICSKNEFAWSIDFLVTFGFFALFGGVFFLSHLANKKDIKNHPFTHYIICPIRLTIVYMSTEAITVQGAQGKMAQFPLELFQQLNPRVSNAVSQMTIIISGRILEDPECDLLIPPTKPMTK